MFNSFEQCTWESIDILNAKYKELANCLSTSKRNASYVNLTTAESDDESLLTPNLQQQHHNLLNTEDLLNESNTLAPNHVILMEAQSNTNQKTDFDEFHQKMLNYMDQHDTNLKEVKENVLRLVGRNPIATENVINTNLSGSRPESNQASANTRDRVGGNPVMI